MNDAQCTFPGNFGDQSSHGGNVILYNTDGGTMMLCQVHAERLGLVEHIRVEGNPSSPSSTSVLREDTIKHEG